MQVRSGSSSSPGRCISGELLGALEHSSGIRSSPSASCVQRPFCAEPWAVSCAERFSRATRQLTALTAHSTMATLVCRSGDPQALKPAAAAAATGSQLALLPLEQATAWRKLLSDASEAPSAQLFLMLPDGTAVADATAAARCVGACPAAAAAHLHHDHACCWGAAIADRNARINQGLGCLRVPRLPPTPPRSLRAPTVRRLAGAAARPKRGELGGVGGGGAASRCVRWRHRRAGCRGRAPGGGAGGRPRLPGGLHPEPGRHLRVCHAEPCGRWVLLW